MTESSPNDLYTVLGEGAIRQIVGEFYRQVPDDPILGPMYPQDDLPGAEERLRLFLVYRLGGPDTYLKERGHPALRMRHAPFRVNQAARDRWVKLMDRAIDSAEIDQQSRATLKQFLHHTASFLVNSPD